MNKNVLREQEGECLATERETASSHGENVVAGSDQESEDAVGTRPKLHDAVKKRVISESVIGGRRDTPSIGKKRWERRMNRTRKILTKYQRRDKTTGGDKTKESKEEATQDYA